MGFFDESLAATAAVDGGGVADQILRGVWQDFKARVGVWLDAHAEDVVFSALLGIVKVRVKHIRHLIERLLD